VKNTRTIFGIAGDGWEVKDPSKVMSAGLIYDGHKRTNLSKLWEKAYKEIGKQFPKLKLEEEFFWSETSTMRDKPSMLSEIRYFTPKNNRKRLG